MPVFRVERTHDYTVMSNFHLKDKRLSLKAKGGCSLRCYLLPDDWDYTLSGLCFINRESKGWPFVLQSMNWNALGIFDADKLQMQMPPGKFGSNEYSIYERPITDSPSLGSPSSEKTDNGKADSGETVAGNSDTIKY